MKVAVIYNKNEPRESDVINIFGPITKEKYNPKTVERVAAALEKGGHNVKIVEGNISVADELQNFMPRVMAGERPGMVFNMAYGIQGQSRYTHIPAMLEMLGVPYCGSGPQAHAIALDKVMSKIVFQQYQLPTAKFWVFSNPHENIDEVVYPVIVKPKMEAVSMGLRVVDNERDLRDSIQEIIEVYNQQALVEQFIPGREFAVGLLGNGQDLEIFPVVEFDFGGNRNAIQTNEAKLHNPPRKICPAEIPEETASKLQTLARDAFYALEIYDFARVDFRMDEEGNIFILELNSMASLGQTGSYVHAAKAAGYTYESMVNRMLEAAAVRYFGEEYYQFQDADQKPVGKQPLRVRVRSYVRSNLTTMADSVRRLVEMNSYVYNTEGVNALGNWITNRMTQLGFQRQVFPQVEVGNILYFSNHLEETNQVLIIGHLDTYHSYQNSQPFREERGRFFGSGVAESKGGLAILLTALQALRYTRRLKNLKCGILLTSDDSLGGRYSKKIIAELARRSRYIIGLKQGSQRGGIVTSCAGEINYKIEFTNQKSTEPATIREVIPVLCQKVLSWQKLSRPEQNIRVIATRIEAQTIHGRIPDFGVVELQVEFKQKDQGEQLDEEIRKIAKKGTNAHLNIRVRKGVSRHPIIETEKIKAFYELIEKLAKRLEVHVHAIHRSQSSNLCHVPDDLAIIDGMGPVGGEVRTPDEFIFRDSLVDRATLLAMTIRECAKEDAR